MDQTVDGLMEAVRWFAVTRDIGELETNIEAIETGHFWRAKLREERESPEKV